MGQAKQMVNFINSLIQNSDWLVTMTDVALDDAPAGFILAEILPSFGLWQGIDRGV